MKARLTYLAFNFALLGLYPLLGMYLLVRRFKLKKSAESVAGLLGRVPAQCHAPTTPGNGPTIWVHAVSVGETMAAKPIIVALRRQFPQGRILLSNTTDTGHELGAAMVQKGEIDGAFFYPMDLPFAVNRALKAVRPDALLFVETELWPNALHLARRRGVVTLLVNGRVSDNLRQMAPRLGPLWQWMMGNLSGLLMRTQEDAKRILELGAPSSKVLVTGDVKLEAPQTNPEELRSEWRSRLGLSRDALVWVAGSTHPGEEQMAIEAHRQLQSEYPQLKLALAPRHVDRADEVAALIGEAGFNVTRRSQNKTWGEDDVFLLDTVGELADFFALADVSFVGGSLIERGGHNVLEPVLRGTPVLFGPYMMNFLAAAALVQEAGLGTRVQDRENLAPAVEKWLKQSHQRHDFATRVESALGPHRGAAARVAQAVQDHLKAAGRA